MRPTLLIRKLGGPVRRLRRDLSSRFEAAGPSFADFLDEARQKKSRTGQVAPPPPREAAPSMDVASLDRSPLPRERLTDRFGRHHDYLRISLTERCNLRCEYCMPAEGVADLTPAPALLDAREIGRIASVWSRAGGTKVRLTGGEPTLRWDLVEICEGLGRLESIASLGMTTNGVLLLSKKTRGGRPLLDRLVEAGCTSLNISLDSLDAASFARLTRRPPATHGKVLAAIEAASQLPGVTVKVNCVVMRGRNEADLGAFAWAFAVDRGVDVRFIEWMPFASNDWDKSVLVPYAEMQERVREVLPSLRRVDDGDPNSTTKWFAVGDDSSSSSSKKTGRVGFITSMSDHFCGSCNRIRVTADGALKTCLFGRDALSLRDMLRAGATDDDLARGLQAALAKKHFKHGGHDAGVDDLAADSRNNRPMVLIGG